MIYAANTPNNTGVAVYGDYMDFNELYEALHAIVGDEGEYLPYDAARIRVLGVCYDIRHALMGDREIEFVDNGLNEDMMKRLSVITHDKNIYFKINVLWPEMLFVTMALNDFILLNRKKCKYPPWDKTTAAVRKFQAAVSECIRQTVSDASYKRILNMMSGDCHRGDGYTRQYLDILNYRFVKMNKEKRLKNISVMAKRLVERGEEYKMIQREVREAAARFNCHVDDVGLQLDFPEEIEW